MDLREIFQYQTREGRSPFREWLLSIKDFATRTRIQTRIDRLQLGNLGDCKGVGQGVFELRFHFGPGFRVYFGQDGRTLILLLCGGDKATQAKDVRLAQEFWEDYKRRKNP